MDGGKGGGERGEGGGCEGILVHPGSESFLRG